MLLNDPEFPVHEVKARKQVGDKPYFLDIINIQVPRKQVQAYRALTAHSAHSIDMMRVRLNDELLLSMAVLPFHWRRTPAQNLGQVQWIPIELDTIPKSKLLSVAQLSSYYYHALLKYWREDMPDFTPFTRLPNVSPIVQRNGRYWTTTNEVITECFLVCNRPTWYPTQGDVVTINTGARPFSKQDCMEEERKFEQYHTAEPRGALLGGALGQKLILGEKKNGEFTFWSFPPILSEPYCSWLGAVEFRYKPGVGLIAADYSECLELPVSNVLLPNEIRGFGDRLGPRVLFEPFEIDGLPVAPPTLPAPAIPKSKAASPKRLPLRR
ncbi:hypothetical protein [Hymenobacter crusticola]|uniref:hypothetical protein n=1 Tax=Hymenobacter crusticola TaxID=1770526 RepID=UPI00117BB7B3|nr:hypothetical protein [Hymenobacter crusticola]